MESELTALSESKCAFKPISSNIYSPALTLRGLFLQFLTFFSCTQVCFIYLLSYEAYLSYLD
jgi:hypothetical protein